MKTQPCAWTRLPQVKIIGRMMFDPAWSRRMHSPHGLEMLHVLSGRINVISDRTALTAQAGDLVLIPSGVRHRDDFDARQDIEVFFCSMDWEHENAFLKPFGRPRRPLLMPLRHHDALRILEDLRTDQTSDLGADRIIAGARIMTILMLMYRHAVRPPAPTSADTETAQTKQRLLLEQAKDYINRHYAEHISLEAIAAALKVSPYYLSRIFRQESKFTLYSFLTDIRMQKAKILLTDGHKNVAEAAYATGFDNPHYFSKVFHRHHGCAPTAFVTRQSKAEFRKS